MSLFVYFFFWICWLEKVGKDGVSVADEQRVTQKLVSSLFSAIKFVYYLKVGILVIDFMN